MPRSPTPPGSTPDPHAAERVRSPAVAGYFYPGTPDALAGMVDDLMRAAEDDARASAAPAPKALVAPHAGYVYSGGTAAVAYRTLAGERERIRRVVLIGPSHRVAFRGVAMSSARRFATPLGQVPVDLAALTSLAALPDVGVLDQAHAAEHSLEVHLPFLQTMLPEFALVPLVVGAADPGTVARVLEHVWGGDETLVVVSTDLSHYLDYDTACRVDRETTETIESQRDDLRPEQACGCRPLNGLLRLAGARGLAIRTLAVCNSGDTAGTRERVVGYGAWALA